ncbi:polymorphic toxin type 28 domain-containing protein [Pedobacter sp. KR3-3]|uniref:Polymorphic toxin type 28 domain-containing protein n=1 Tax=Pedobacter albus TaxID=3113905 RepID=A0ABU7IAQ0_9SPHI|nr:polymorphic toxin type 28 domain-containing protein [Pedobacter sp. KR3-3]MEE1946446.1 polymorphic toxin type 28 domain-containing protein [Pedobacter sp. KR3-3]
MKEALEKVVGKVGNIAEHLTEKDMTGAVRDIFGDPVKISGYTYDHLGEVKDALRGLGNQIEGLNKGLKKGNFSDEVLTQAEKLRNALQKQKNRLQNILNKAEKAANDK